MLQRQARINGRAFTPELHNDDRQARPEKNTTIQKSRANGNNNLTPVLFTVNKSFCNGNGRGNKESTLVGAHFRKRELVTSQTERQNDKSSHWQVLKQLLRTPKLLSIIGVPSYFR